MLCLRPALLCEWAPLTAVSRPADDEEAMREEMKDLIDDNPIDEEGDDDSSSSDGDGSGDEGGEGRGARKRSREDDLDDGLEDDDYDLIEENLGVKVSRVSAGRRIRSAADPPGPTDHLHPAKLFTDGTYLLCAVMT